MAISIVNKLSTVWYVPRPEIEAASPSRFSLRPLNGMQYMEVIQETTGAGLDIRISGRGLKLALEYGLVDWEGITNAAGEKVNYSRIELQKLPPELLTELANQIIIQSDVTEDEIKNSSSQ
ncbi:MAG: hypothetical protein COB61_004275 [Thiotrichales bacterium]|nr:hypothetical protein [Thiotrichales bacterium]